MVKDDLVFNWQRRESHYGHKLTAVVAVSIIFTVLFGIVSVRMKPPGTTVTEAASVLHFGDDGMGRMWRLRAEEEGPFPGRLQIQSGGDILDVMNSESLADHPDGVGYKAGLKLFQADVSAVSDQLSMRGRRFFPERVGSGVVEKVEATEAPGNNGINSLPVLTPYSREAQQWMPESVPLFDLKMEDDLASASWRFVLSLREDGSVEECVALSGGENDGLKGMCGWLGGLKFREGKGERWFGLRVEFINQ